MTPPDACAACYTEIARSADGLTVVCGRDVGCHLLWGFNEAQVQYWGVLVVIGFLFVLLWVASGRWIE